MLHLHGFTKTLRYNLLMPADVEKQAFCTTMLYRQVVSYYLQVFQEHQEIIGHDKWLDSNHILLKMFTGKSYVYRKVTRKTFLATGGPPCYLYGGIVDQARTRWLLAPGKVRRMPVRVPSPCW